MSASPRLYEDICCWHGPNGRCNVVGDDNGLSPLLSQLHCHWQWFNERNVVIIYWCTQFLSYTLEQFWDLALDIHYPCVRCPASKLPNLYFWVSHDLRAIAPSAPNECAPIMSGLIPWSWGLRALTAILTTLTISDPYTEHQALSGLSLCCSICDEAFKQLLPLVSWWSVCLVRPFFWFLIFIVAESMVSIISNGEYLERTLIWRRKF